MGQQQLLLIVLGVIIVGVAIVVGINLFNAQSEQSTKDAMVASATNIAAMAQQYYKKPTAMGGGGNTFTGYVIPTNLATDANGKYEGTIAGNKYTIKGTPATGGFTVTTEVNMGVNPPTITSTIGAAAANP